MMALDNSRTSALLRIRCSEEVNATPALKELQTLITPDYAHCWEEIGIGLNLSYGTLQAIESNYNKVQKRCTHMLATWLQQDVNATWKKLFEIIDSPAITKISSESDHDEIVDTCIQLAADHLCQSYIESKRNVPADEWPPYHPEHYTTLALIHIEEHTSTEVIAVTKELANKGRIESKNEKVIKRHDDKICYQSKSISEIFSKDSPTGRYLILIEGAPGIGKTVLSKEIAFQWANNVLLKCRKLVFLFFLRDSNLKNVHSLEDLMAYVFKVNVINNLAKYLFETRGKDVTIILDGYDEISEEQRQNSFIADIINSTVLPECGLVITSRPTASAHLHTEAHCRVEILGFTEADRLDYINYALQGNDHKIEEIKFYLQSHATIDALCYIPLNMTILLSLFFEASTEKKNMGTCKLPNTQTELCENFIRVTITRYMRKILKTNFFPAPELSDLPEPHNKVFHELSKLAYDALTKDQIVFTREELNKACPNLTMRHDNWNGLGLVKAAHYSTYTVSFNFHHFSIQEYMAAYYIASLPNKEQLSLLKNTFWDIHYFNTWIMYVGITHGENFIWKHFLSENWLQISTRLSKRLNISKKLLQNKIKCLHLFQCFTEGSNDSIEQLAQSVFQDRTINLSNQTLHPKDINILGYFLLRSDNKHWKKIDLSRCNLRETGCNILCKMFMDKSNREMLKVDEVDFSCNHLQLDTLASLTALLDIFKSWSTKDAFLCGNNTVSYTISEELEYFEEITSKFFVYSVSIGESLFGNKATQNSLSNQLSRSIHFTGLYLSECIWQENSSLNKKFVDMIKRQKFTRIHIIGKTNTYCIREIAEAAKQAETVYIYDSTLEDEDVDKIAHVLQNEAEVSDIALAIGQNKIIGKLHTSRLNNLLSPTEIYHLFSNIKNLCSNPSQPLFDYIKLARSSRVYHTKNMYDLFTQLQHNLLQCKVSVCMVEDNILVAHRCKCEDINERLYNHPSLNSVYISQCDFYNNIQFHKFVYSVCEQNLLLNCHILHSNLDTDLIEYFCSKLQRKKENSVNKFYPLERFDTLSILIHSIHPSCKVTSEMFGLDNHEVHDSVLLITKDAIVGHNITHELFSLSLQLQSQVTAWKFCHCKLDYKMLNLINSVHVVERNCLITELDFSCCTIVGEIGPSSLFLKNNYTYLTKINISGIMEFHKIVKDAVMFLLHNAQLKQLDISNLHLDLNNFRLLAQSLFNHTNLTKLNISNIGDVYDEDIAVILSNNVKMEELDLSNLKIKDYSILANSLKNFLHLKKLNISNNIIMPHIIGDILSHNTKLEHLNLSNLSLCLEDLIFIANVVKVENVSNLKSLDISRNNAHGNSSTNTDSMDVIFSQNLHLEELNLSDISLDSKDFISIATAMTHLSNLRKLNISNNKIDGNAIITLLYHTINLEILDLSNIKLEKATDIIKMAKVMQKRSTLTKINICCNEVTNDAADAIAAILPNNKKLKEITLNVCKYDCTIKISENLTRFVLEDFILSLSSQVAYTIAAFLSNISMLEVFHFCSNRMKAADTIRVFESMKYISTLKTMHFYSKCINEAANAVAKTIANNAQLNNIILNHHIKTPSAAIKLFSAMSNLSDLIKLDVSFNKFTTYYEGRISRFMHYTTAAHTAVQCLASVLAQNTKLQEVNMKLLNPNQKEAIVIFKSMKSLTNLTYLNVTWNSITNEVAKILASVLEHNISLQRLNMSDCSLQTEGAIDIFNAIRDHSCLRWLDIDNNDVTNDAAKVLASVLSHNISLQSFNLEGCSLQTEGAIDIFNALRNHSSLRWFSIEGNRITNDAANILSSLLSHNTSLEWLDLSYCSLQTEGAIDIFNALRNNSCLTSLDISYNDIMNDAAKTLASILSHNACLKKLNLRHCLLQTEGAIAIFNAIKNNSCLTSLDISRNNITNDVAKVLASVLYCNISLQKLYLCSCSLQTEGAMDIFNAMRNHPSLAHLRASRNYNIGAKAEALLREICSKLIHPPTITVN